MKNKNIILPGLLTVCNIFCGFLAIIKVIEGDILDAAWLIVIAAFFDTIDGRVAQLTNSASFFGLEFDSLADLVSFGVAPALLIYQTDFFQIGFLGIFLCFIYVVAGALRLARFNIQSGGFTKHLYNGLPITFSALVLSTFIIFSYDIWGFIPFTGLLIPFVIGLSALMISSIKYDSISILSFLESEPFNVKALIFYCIVFILFIFPGKTIFPFSILFVIYGIIKSLSGYLKKETEEVINI